MFTISIVELDLSSLIFFFFLKERELAATRALWYCCSKFQPPQPQPTTPGAKFDPYEERSAMDIFGFDVRALKNVRCVTQALRMYLDETITPILPTKGYEHLLTNFPLEDVVQTRARVQVEWFCP
jgi:hypothetical protein